jgi:DNA-binding Lrp family transcriptional regulator
MRISEQEARILSVVEFHADLTLPEIQKRTGYRAHVIRYCLSTLERAGVIRSIPFVDMYPLGYQDFGFYFSLAALQSQAKQELLRVLKESPFITFLIELGGDYQYCAGMYVRHNGEFIRILDHLSERAENLFFDKAVTMRVALTRFGRKYLNPTAPLQMLSFGETRTRVELDTLDERILTVLNQHEGGSMRALAQQLGISFSTAQHRLQRIKKSGVFRGRMYTIDPMRIGRQAYLLLIYAKGLKHSFQSELFAYAKRHPDIVYFVRCIGAWDFEIGVEVERAEHVTQISQEIYEKMGTDILSIKILPIFSFLKFMFFRPSESPALNSPLL